MCVMCNKCSSVTSHAVNKVCVCLNVESFVWARAGQPSRMSVGRDICAAVLLRRVSTVQGRKDKFLGSVSSVYLVCCHCHKAVACIFLCSYVSMRPHRSNACYPPGTMLWIGRGGLCWGCCWMLKVKVSLPVRHNY